MYRPTRDACPGRENAAYILIGFPCPFFICTFLLFMTSPQFQSPTPPIIRRNSQPLIRSTLQPNHSLQKCTTCPNLHVSQSKPSVHGISRGTTRKLEFHREKVLTAVGREEEKTCGGVVFCSTLQIS